LVLLYLHHRRHLAYLIRPPPPTSTLFPLHDALPISRVHEHAALPGLRAPGLPVPRDPVPGELLRPTRHHRRRGAASTWAGRRRADRKSTRLNSSHGSISYAVFCLKKQIAIAVTETRT